MELNTQQKIIFEIYDLYKKFELIESNNKCKKLSKRIEKIKNGIVVKDIYDVNYVDRVQEILLNYREIWGFIYKSSIKQWIATSKTINVAGIFYKDDLIGVMVYGERPNYLKINYIAVDKKFKDKSLGGYFIQFLEKKAKKLKKKKIYAEVPKINENGLRFFIKNRFVIEGILKNHTRRDKDLVLMAKYLEG
ncbi:GNAT family N-acetyltransferase [Methanocaldococcus indicus]|uniref:GNAT family N-acetyltransferase n=1 Tax=Methanocaldococcus indicus TaxID=213231 RepID=UPI003C6CCB43